MHQLASLLAREPLIAMKMTLNLKQRELDGNSLLVVACLIKSPAASLFTSAQVQERNKNKNENKERWATKAEPWQMLSLEAFAIFEPS